MNKFNKLLVIIFGILIILIGCFLVRSGDISSKVPSEVLEKIQENNSARVIISLKEDSFKEKKFNILGFEKKDKIKEIKEKEDVIEFSSGGFSVEVDESELNDLIKDERILDIEPVRYFHTFLQDSVPLINASVIWPVEISDLNLTGISQTICIIDTGVNFSHPDLQGKNVTACNLDCINKTCIENCSENDFNGHGTHVAGIVAASGSINGVAKGANIISLKVFPGSNASGATTDGIKNAIDWCVDNSAKYNISVISMSLGTDTQYAKECDSEFNSFNTSITNAFDKNILVIVATGNEGNITGISAPACISKAIPVGDVYDADIGKVIWENTCTDSTTAADKIVCHANRNSLVQLFAPGALINSTKNDGAYFEQGGTSMAAPHVAGAFAIFNQFLNLTGITKTPWQIEEIFNSTGKQINDTEGTGLNFSRIDVYAAIQSIDASNPVVSLTSPENNTAQFIQNVSFSCSANDVQLDNITLYVWNSSGDVYNNVEIEEVSGVNGILKSNISDIPYGNYEWNCLAYDENNNFSFASSNFSFSIGQISTTLNSPKDNSFVNTNQTYNCSAETEPTKLLSNITFYAWNSTNDLVYNATENINGTTNSSLFYFNFTTEQNYTWNCLGYNNETEKDWADSNFSVTYDVTNPLIKNKSE